MGGHALPRAPLHISHTSGAFPGPAAAADESGFAAAVRGGYGQGAWRVTTSG
ncbi:MAG TPA: hypothetical protein VG248_15240 [Caulobacteraceae bacterium]|jgi:hypothetical protein|nr:hypothetical protein [Caulobacteraceae bacterium]